MVVAVELMQQDVELVHLVLQEMVEQEQMFHLIFQVHQTVEYMPVVAAVVDIQVPVEPVDLKQLVLVELVVVELVDLFHQEQVMPVQLTLEAVVVEERQLVQVMQQVELVVQV